MGGGGGNPLPDTCGHDFRLKNVKKPYKSAVLFFNNFNSFTAFPSGHPSGSVSWKLFFHVFRSSLQSGIGSVSADVSSSVPWLLAGPGSGVSCSACAVYALFLRFAHSVSCISVSLRGVLSSVRRVSCPEPVSRVSVLPLCRVSCSEPVCRGVLRGSVRHSYRLDSSGLDSSGADVSGIVSCSYISRRIHFLRPFPVFPLHAPVRMPENVSVRRGVMLSCPFMMCSAVYSSAAVHFCGSVLSSARTGYFMYLFYSFGALRAVKPARAFCVVNLFCGHVSVLHGRSCVPAVSSYSYSCSFSFRVSEAERSLSHPYHLSLTGLCLLSVSAWLGYISQFFFGGAVLAVKPARAFSAVRISSCACNGNAVRRSSASGRIREKSADVRESYVKIQENHIKIGEDQKPHIQIREESADLELTDKFNHKKLNAYGKIKEAKRSAEAEREICPSAYCVTDQYLTINFIYRLKKREKR